MYDLPRKYKCKIDNCKFATIYKHSLKYHIKTHTKSKPYLCNFIGCKKTFTQISSLNVHKKKHDIETANILLLLQYGMW